MASRTIRQTVEFRASPDDVYEALMDSRNHARFTGAKATVSRKIGGKFSVWDGYATGKNIELVQGKKIVQTWRASDWPEGAESKLVFRFTRTAKGTKMSFIQTGVPEEFAPDIRQGWKDFYWAPMKKMLEE